MPYLQAMPDLSPARRPRVFVTRRLPGDALERLARDADVDLWNGELPPPYDELARRAAAADGIICLLTDRIDAALLGAPRAAGAPPRADAGR